MNKRELILAVKDEMGDGNSAGAVGRAVEAAFNVMTKALERGEQVRISGFGTLRVKGRKGRTGRNPQTGESVEIPAGKAVKLTPSNILKEALNSQVSAGESHPWLSPRGSCRK